MKTQRNNHHLMTSLFGAAVLLILPAAHAQYDWGTWTQNTGASLNYYNSALGTASLAVTGLSSPSASVATGTFPNSWGTIAAAGVYSQLQTGSVMTNALFVDIDLSLCDVSAGTSVFGFSDVAAIGYGQASLSYRITAYDNTWTKIPFDWTDIYHEGNIQLPTDIGTLTINPTTGVLVFDNPQAGQDSLGYFYQIDPQTAHIRLEALRTTGGDGIRFYIGSPAVPEPGTCALIGLGLAGLFALRQTRRQG
jgi:hypothetical protein